ncbi:catalase HPII, partial [Streptomyces sp. NPDC048551]
LGTGKNAVTVQRTFATARSTEFDALLIAGAPAPAADADGARDAKAGAGRGKNRRGTAPATTDPRVLLLVSEMFRHAKAIGGWAGAGAVLQEAGVPAGAPGVVDASTPADAAKALAALVAEHRVWDRFPAA